MIRKFWEAFKRGYEDGRRREMERRAYRVYWAPLHAVLKKYHVPRRDWIWMAGRES